MYVYKVNDDGVTCAVMAHRPTKVPPEGWLTVPPNLENRALYMIDGELTDQKPQHLIDEEVAFIDNEIKIQAKIRELAIRELIKNGELPKDFK